MSGWSTATSRRVLLACIVALVGVVGLALTRGGAILRGDLAARLAGRLGMMGWVDRAYVAQVLDTLPLSVDRGSTGARGLPDIVLIVLDTVRPDRTAIYGYANDSMPHLGRWSRRARVYTEARSSSSWTVPAHASLFTGLPPIEHGAHGTPYTPGETVAYDVLPLRRDVPTLAGALRVQGYVSVGIAANKGYLASSTGLSRGFDAWLCEGIPGRAPYPSADRVTSMALQIAGAPRDKPLFLFLNYMDAHQPIHVREGYTTEPVDRDLLPYTSRWQEYTRRLMEAHEPLPPALVESWSRGYDGELRFLDEHLGRLLRGLPSLGIGDDDIVIILSDHGELFGEHDLVEHSKSLYQGLVRILLLARGPGFAPGRDARPVEIQDVPDWILDAVGAPPIAPVRRPKSLQVMELYWTRHKDLESEPLRARFDRVLRAYVQNGVEMFRTDSGDEVFYDLEADPDERHALPDAPADRALQAAADRWLHDHPQRQATPGPPTKRGIDNLRALGYLE